MRSHDDFVIPAFNRSPLNHYRVRDGHVQFRSIDRGSFGSWRTLTEADVLMHLALKTPVAEWLYTRHGLVAGTMLYRAS